MTEHTQAAAPGTFRGRMLRRPSATWIYAYVFMYVNCYAHIYIFFGAPEIKLNIFYAFDSQGASSGK